LSPPMRSIGNQAIKSIQENFKVGGRHNGNPDSMFGGSQKWQPSFRAQNEGGRTLIKDGGLKNSMSMNVTNQSVEIRNGKKYGAIHHFGGKIVPVSADKLAFRLADGKFIRTDSVEIPARPWFHIQTTDVPYFIKFLENHLTRI